jgi:TolB-like protein
MMDDTQRRLAAIVLADVAGYSRLMGIDETGTLAALRSHRSELVDAQVARHGGRLVKAMGDGLLLEFPSIVAAVDCSVGIQKGMIERNSGVADGDALRFRIGIHLGDVIIEGDDIFGDGVNVAARIEALADPDGIAISDDVYRQVRDRLDIGWLDDGEHEVKNIARPVRVWRWNPATSPYSETGVLEPGHAPTLSNKPSIAVLPFANMSGDPEQEYFADGMVDEIITGLARIRWLTVIARNSTFAYKGKAPDVRKVGQDLAVRYVLEGSVRKSGDRVRITAQLIETGTGGHLWADKFDGSLSDVFDLQDQITVGVVAAIEPSVRQAEIERAKRKRPDNLDAYDLYLRALEQAYSFTQAGRSAALVFLNAALKLAPDYAEAHGVAAYCLQQQFLWGGRVPEDRVAALAHAEAVAASRTDDSSALAFAALAKSALDNDSDSAVAMLERALAQNPNSSLAHSISALVEVRTGNFNKSIEHAENAIRLSPFDPLRFMAAVAWAGCKLAQGDNEAALTGARRALECNPDFQPAMTTLAICLVRLGRLDEARATVQRVVDTAPDTRLETVVERLLFADAVGADRVISDLRAAGLPD